MDIWALKKWKTHYDLTDHGHRTGVRIYYDKDIDPEVKRACKELLSWVRKKYFFPQRIRIYVKPFVKIKALDGDLVCATGFMPGDMDDEPYIRVATGDYSEMLEKWGKNAALWHILFTIAYQLTGYFQWINDLDLKLTEIGMKRQATMYAYYVLNEYEDTHEHF